ncbi:MAG: hypothetical protein V2A79_13980 [Planctomycetota bacterium]
MPRKKATEDRKAKHKTLAESNGGRKRGRKPYPTITFDQALSLAQGIIEHAAGHPIKRLTLLEKLNLDHSAVGTRNLITNSTKYGLTLGSYAAEELRLSDLGRVAVSADSSQQERAESRFKLAIDGVEHFQTLYDKFKGNKLPAREVMRDALEMLHEADRPQCVDIFISNAKAIGLLKTISGAERLLTREQSLKDLSSAGHDASYPGEIGGAAAGADSAFPVEVDFNTVCFFIAPIGKEGDEERKHSDMILSSFVEPALEDQRLQVIRADKIDKAGMISKQVVEYILRSRLVVADLSFQNPNVFYELALRHVTGKPTVHLIRSEDKIPFDVGNFRTIQIDMGCKYNLVARIDTYRSDIANQVRQALGDDSSTDNPILTFFPEARIGLRDKER